MENSIVIKGNKNGIVIVVPENVDFVQIKSLVRSKFIESAKFFGNATMALGFEGQSFTTQQQQEIADIIMEVSDLHIVCLIDDDSEREAYFGQVVQQAMQPQAVSAPNVAEQVQMMSSEMLSDAIMQDDLKEGLYYKGTLRSGQSICADGSVIVLGDINPGGRIVAKGSVIVLGSLKGNANAGADGNEHAFVVALDMDPMQIKIGDVIARSSDSTPRKRLKKSAKVIQPKIAFVEDGNIYIEDLEQNVIDDIRFAD